MCGRYGLFETGEDLFRDFDLVEIPDLAPRYNIAPSQEVSIVRLDEGLRRLLPARWGLIPSWAKDAKIAYRTINARGETVFEKPSFRAAVRARRCLIPASGFYEWKKEGKTKVPHWIRLKNKSPMAFAGLWERWISPHAEAVDSCTIVTTEANDLVRTIHERMPVILPRDARETWLDLEITAPERLRSLLVSYPPAEMEIELADPARLTPARRDPPDSR